MIRCPGNQMCNPKAKYRPGSQHQRIDSRTATCRPTEAPQLPRLPAAHPDFVGVGPKVEASACRVPVDGARLSQASNAKAAQDMAAYYKTMP